MIFEDAINHAFTLFLFDRRSLKKLDEMIDQTEANTRDWYMIRLTQASFIYYNDFDEHGWNMPEGLNLSWKYLQECKYYKKEKLFSTLALRMELDIRLHMSRRVFARESTASNIFNSHDQRAMDICSMLLRNMEALQEYLPQSWYTGLLPLYPPYKTEILEFYQSRNPEHRESVIKRLLSRIKREIQATIGILEVKSLFRKLDINPQRQKVTHEVLLNSVTMVMAELEAVKPLRYHVLSNIVVPRRVNLAMIEKALGEKEKQIQTALTKRVPEDYISLSLQAGILHFLVKNNDQCIHHLGQVLQSSHNLERKVLKLPQYQYHNFSDIPFMIGSAFLYKAFATGIEKDLQRSFLGKAKRAFLRAIQLAPAYHEAYANLILIMAINRDEELEATIDFYLSRFSHDTTSIDKRLFENIAFFYIQEPSKGTQRSLSTKWRLLSLFFVQPQRTGENMLNELKTLYVLNAYNISTTYFDTYLHALQQKQKDFIADISNPQLHSAILFYIGHAFLYSAMTPKNNVNDIHLNYDNLNHSIYLNVESLQFHPTNSSALRMLESQISILQYAQHKTEKLWEKIDLHKSQRITAYENYLFESMIYQKLRQELAKLKMPSPTEFVLSDANQAKIDLHLNEKEKANTKARVVKVFSQVWKH